MRGEPEIRFELQANPFASGGSYHVVDYNSTTGAVFRQRTSQGYADNRYITMLSACKAEVALTAVASSTWSRGEAWGIYGFANSKYLRQASRLRADLLCKCSSILVTSTTFKQPARWPSTGSRTHPPTASSLGSSPASYFYSNTGLIQMQGLQRAPCTAPPCGLVCGDDSSQRAAIARRPGAFHIKRHRLHLLHQRGHQGALPWPIALRDVALTFAFV